MQYLPLMNTEMNKRNFVTMTRVLRPKCKKRQAGSIVALLNENYIKTETQEQESSKDHSTKTELKTGLMLRSLEVESRSWE